MKSEMKRCPFCDKAGTIDRIKTFRGIDVYYPRCNTNHCVGNNGWVSFDTEEEAIKAWNKRMK